MIDLLGAKGTKDTEIIRHFCMPGKEVADVLATPTMTFEFCKMPLNLEVLALQLGYGLALGEGIRHRFPVHLVKLWLVVKSLKVGGSTRHAKENDALGPGFGK